MPGKTPIPFRGDGLLTCVGYTDPDPVQISDAQETLADITVTIRNDDDRNAICKEITITLPVGPKPTDLTEEDTFSRLVSSDINWRLTKVQGERGVYLAKPKKPTVPPGDEGAFTLTIGGIKVNKMIGTAKIVVTEQSGKPITSREATAVLAKLPKSFAFGDFRPDRILVKRGYALTLSWEATDRPGASYVLSYGGIEEPIADKVRQWTLYPRQDTAFQLRLDYRESGAPAVTRTLSTFVTVAEPDLITGKLTVLGTARLLSSRQSIAAGSGKLTLDPEHSTVIAENNKFIAGTDGLLTVSVRSHVDMTPATARVRLSKGSWTYTAAVNTRDKQDGECAAPLVLAVPAGALLDITHSGKSGFSPRTNWLGFGTGLLSARPAQTRRGER
ncbi:hypothetical protein [Amycolatopsis sulphurea]|nr:hypothetical protein [Amycolatopsis sulphurea]